jgi:uncharacterized membrane protein
VESQLKFLGHPVHLIVFVFSVAAFVWAILCDITGLVFGKVFWFSISYWLTLVAMMVSLVVLVFGWVDWFYMPPWLRCKTVTLCHAGANFLVTLLFCCSFLLRENSNHKPFLKGVACSVIGLFLALVSAWLAAKLLNCFGLHTAPAPNLDPH